MADDAGEERGRDFSVMDVTSVPHTPLAMSLIFAIPSGGGAVRSL